MSSDKPDTVPAGETRDEVSPSPRDDDTVDAVLYEEQVQPEYGILGLTLRELVIVGAWLVLFVVSFFPLTAVHPLTIWGSGIDWILTVGVPTVAVFLIVLRRFSPEGIRRVGSLGIDQFASVAASVSAVVWAQLLWQQIEVSAQSGVFIVGWPVMVAQLAAAVLVAVTVGARFFPRLREDFEGRMETLAHRNANPVRPVIARPRAVASAPEPDSADAETPPAAVPQGEQPVLVDSDLTVVIDDAALVTPSAALEAPTAALEAPTELPADDAGEPGTTIAADAVIEPDAGGQDAGEPNAVEPDAGEQDAVLEQDTTPRYSESGPIEVYNTGAIDALQGIFEADGVTMPVAIVSSDTGTLLPGLDPQFGPQPETPETSETSETQHPQPETQPDEPPAAADDTSAPATSKPAPLRRTRAESSSYAPQPFWVLAQTERDVLDELGQPLFRIGPTDWTLVIEDRGGAFVVRHEDGRIGYLHDLSDITRG